MNNFSTLSVNHTDHSLKQLFFAFSLLYLSGSIFVPDLKAFFVITLYISFVLLGWHLTKRRLTFGRIGSVVDLSPAECRFVLLGCYVAFSGFVILGIWRIQTIGVENFFFVSRATRALVTRSDLIASVFDDVLVGLFWLISAIHFVGSIRRRLWYWVSLLIILLFQLFSVLYLSDISTRIRL